MSKDDALLINFGPEEQYRDDDLLDNIIEQIMELVWNNDIDARFTRGKL